MPWIWTDDLARLLLDASLVTSDQVQPWLSRPIGIAVGDDADPLTVARSLLGPPDDETEVVGAA